MRRHQQGCPLNGSILLLPRHCSSSSCSKIQSVYFPPSRPQGLSQLAVQLLGIQQASLLHPLQEGDLYNAISCMRGQNRQQMMSKTTEKGLSICRIFIPHPPPPMCTRSYGQQDLVVLHLLARHTFASHVGRLTCHLRGSPQLPLRQAWVPKRSCNLEVTLVQEDHWYGSAEVLPIHLPQEIKGGDDAAYLMEDVSIILVDQCDAFRLHHLLSALLLHHAGRQQTAQMVLPGKVSCDLAAKARHLGHGTAVGHARN
mmetsp:Transcript_25975/g.60716  ORF Transcript_25975/g.60716 Transcript_25975/m.60716 type:complete len:256 (+) Transcript_25975:158-925(+)